MRIDPDYYGSASLRNVVSNLSGPLASGAAVTPVVPTAAGRLTVSWQARRPVVVVSLAQMLDTDAVTIDVTVDPDGAARAGSRVTFAAYSEAGATLPLYVPALGPDATSVEPFTLAVEVTSHRSDGSTVVLPGGDIPTHLSFEVVEGNMGKLLLLLVQEKARIRREARQLASAKLLAGAGLDALDRIGAEVGVARFQDDLVYDPDKREVKTVILTDAAGDPAVESDTDYARRLGLYRPFLLASPGHVLETLNGVGAVGDDNAGLIAGLGLKHRFVVDDHSDPFAIAIRVIGIGSQTPRTNFLSYLRSDVLVWLPDSAQANAAHAARYLPSMQQQSISALRGRLRQAYSFPGSAAVAPALAKALDRLGRVLAALGHSSTLTITRAQDPAAGSRYELGLGVDVTAPPAASLDTLAAAAGSTTRPATDDQLAESLIAAMRDRTVPASQDPDGVWLFSGCGFQTVHRIDSSTLYLSHTPVSGLVVDGPTSVAVGAAGAYAAHFYPAEDVAINAALFAGLQTAAGDWTAAGETAWSQLAAAQQATAWGQVVSQPQNAPALETFAAAGLPAIADPTQLMASLTNVPADMLATIALDNGLASAIRTGTPAGIDALRRLVATLRSAGLVSTIPLVTSANAVILVVSVVGLPTVGVNLADRRASGFRWYTVPLGGRGTVKGFGSSTTVTPSAAGALALVCLGYARRGVADPYEVVVDLPETQTMTLKQYEFLMNALQRLYPVGIQVNTYGIRQRHVDLDGDGRADPLTASVSKTYRSFQRSRLRGNYQQTS